VSDEYKGEGRGGAPGTQSRGGPYLPQLDHHRPLRLRRLPPSDLGPAPAPASARASPRAPRASLSRAATLTSMLKAAGRAAARGPRRAIGGRRGGEDGGARGRGHEGSAGRADLPQLRLSGGLCERQYGRRDETCPVSTGGGTRRVQSVREGGRGGVGGVCERQVIVERTSGIKQRAASSEQQTTASKQRA